MLCGCTIDLVTVFNAILTSRQTREKLQYLYENLMSNNFRRFWEVFLDSGTCFGFREVFFDSGMCFGFWDVFLDSGTCFGFWDVFLDSGKCF